MPTANIFLTGRGCEGTASPDGGTSTAAATVVSDRAIGELFFGLYRLEAGSVRGSAPTRVLCLYRIREMRPGEIYRCLVRHQIAKFQRFLTRLGSVAHDPVGGLGLLHPILQVSEPIDYIRSCHGTMPHAGNNEQAEKVLSL